MKLSDKLYIEVSNGVIFVTKNKERDGVKEYISKDALIDKLYKWFEEDTTVADYYTKDAFAKVVDKLFG